MNVTDLMLVQLVIVCVMCHSYEDNLQLFRDKFRSDNYSVDIRPLRNQSEVLNVYVTFSILYLLGIDEKAQSFTCNGFFIFVWKDEIIAWDPEAYGGQTVIYPKPVDIWRPRLILMNTLDKREILGDDLAPVKVTYSGHVLWAPGNVFSSFCELNMENYPFDQHFCTIELEAMTHTKSEMEFLMLQSNELLTSSYTRNSEWKLKWIRVYIPSKSINNTHSEVKIQILAQRRPFFILLNVILPAIFLSFLNIMVFVIPADSGEKISYGITVLLALSVFLGTVGGMLPKSSNVPMVTVYLFILLILSMLTVINSIIIVFLHHKEEKEEKHRQVKTYFSRALNKITNFRHAVSPVAGAADDQVNQRADLGPEIGSKTKKPESPGVNRYKVIGKYIDLVSFVVFLVMWSAVTISVMVKISREQQDPEDPPDL